MRCLAPAAIAFALAALPSSARAERATTATVGFVLGALVSEDELVVQDGPYPAIGGYQIPEGFRGPRLTLSWDNPALPYPALPGYAVDGQLVPELIAGAFVDDEKLEGMVGVGLRGELRMSQKQQGLFRVSMRAVFYLAARALVAGEQRDLLGELVVGEYFLVRRSGRIGFEIGGVVRREEPSRDPRGGIIGQIFFGWQL